MTGRVFAIVLLLGPLSAPPAASQERPSSFVSGSGEGPRGVVPPTAGSGELTAAAQRAATEAGVMVQSARILAWVGDQTILAGDLMGYVNRALEKYLSQIPDEAREQISPEQLDQQRWILMRQLLPSAIDTKLAYMDFVRSLPQDKLPLVMEQIYRQYDEEQLPQSMKNAGVNTIAELDSKLRALGSSLEKERQMYAEQTLAREMIRQNVDVQQEVTHQEMVDYYQQHIAEYSYPDRVRWEHLCALRSSYPDREAGLAAIAEMGNRVWYGAAFEAVAKASSQGPTADQGGRYDWTTRGTLVSKVLEEAIFTLPVGKLSPILEDEAGWHIVRVIERQSAGRIAFEDVQQEIREKIKNERIDPQINAYLARLRERTEIRTIFDDQPSLPTAAP